MTSWAVRFLIVGGGGGTLERSYCERAKEIRAGTIISTKNLVDAMAAIVPNDSRFKTAFASATVSTNKLARYYLRELENQVKGSVKQPMVANSNEAIVNLEHILPENPLNNWSHVDPETARAFYKRIGNMALMENKINSDIGNEGFMIKRPYYEQSPFELTAELKNYSSWGVKEIEERQNYLADLAVKAWPSKV